MNTRDKFLAAGCEVPARRCPGLFSQAVDVRSLLGVALVFSAKQLCEALTTDALPTASTRAKVKLEALVFELTVELSKKALAAPAPTPSRNTVLVAKLLKAGSKAVDMATNLGFECALQFMARKLVSISSRSVKSSSHDRNSRRKKKSARGQKRQWNLGTVEGFGSGDSDSDTESMGDLLGLSQLSSQLTAVSGRQAADVIASSLAQGKMGGLVMSDVNLSALTVSQAFLDKFLSPLNEKTFLANCVTNHCPPSGRLRQNPHSFPKLWDLVMYLSKYRNDSDFHGIVFATTRHGVFYISALISACWEQLGFIDSVHELTGHSGELMEGGAMEGPMGGVKGGAGAMSEESLLTGMNSKAQQSGTGPASACVNKAPGRRLLVSTSAAEEGLDVPSCKFVVRYNAPQTGVQRVQSRGRVRALENAEFVVIVQEGSLDDHHHMKSTTEENNMLHMLKSQFPRGQ
eukprot:gene10611-12282_t